MVFGWFSKSPAASKGADPRKEFKDTEPPAPQAPSDEAVRHERRGQIFDVVRECMIASGILSAGYKFKVLDADSSHQQFLLLFDLASVFHSNTQRLSDIEAFIQDSAQRRYGLVVRTCYWRVLPDPLGHRAPAPGSMATTPQPEPLPDPKVTARAQLDEMFANDPSSDAPDSVQSEFAPTQFSHSLSELHSNQAKAKQQPNLLFTGFEETEMANSAFKPSSFNKHES